VFLLGSIPGAAQAGYSEDTGEVRDSSGAVIARAEITASSVHTGETFRAATTAAGFYFLSSLRPGTYSISATAPGFRQLIHTDIQLNVGDRQRVDFVLAVGPTSEQLTVSAQPDNLNTETSGLSQVIDHQYIVDLPLSRLVNRDLLQLPDPTAQSIGLPGIPTNSAFSNALPLFNVVGLQRLGPTSNANSNLKAAVIEVTWECPTSI